jgi:hypothetical protein
MFVVQVALTYFVPHVVGAVLFAILGALEARTQSPLAPT